MSIFATAFANVAQLVEHQLPKLRVAGSNPVIRSRAENQQVELIGGEKSAQNRRKFQTVFLSVGQG